MTPRVTAMLAWFDEPTDLLEQAVLSLEGFCDRLVAFDGRYELCPGAEITSPPEQAKAIRAAAKKAGVKAVLRAPTRLWVGQVEKRHAMMQLANNGDADWVMPLDADWVLRGDKPLALAQLAETEAEAMICHFHTPAHPSLPPERTGSNVWHVHTIGVQNFELVFRAMDRMAVELRHWWYTGHRPDGTKVNLWGDADQHAVPATKEDLVGLQIDHLCHLRDLALVERNRRLCEARDLQVAMTGAEA